ncbi:MAG: DUF3987 domain-containing protein, partial [Saprospiraceae bacterium]|nr:DUF3987 domain-containing protein [Saprospiraceae bacterium]
MKHIEFESWVEPLHRRGAELADITGWAGKLCGAVARIAGLLHVAGHGIDSDVISERTMERAISVGHYLIGHAKIAFGLMGSVRHQELAQSLLQWIVRDDCTSFSVRDAHRAMGEKVDSVEQIQTALGVLVEHRYIRAAQPPQPPERTGPGRKPV